MDREVVERLLEQHRIELVRLETPDLNGVSRGKTVTADHFWSFVETGLALVSDIYCWDHECWVATGTGFGEDLTFADLSMRPDLSTFAVLPHVDAAGPRDLRHALLGRTAGRGEPAAGAAAPGRGAAAEGLTARMQAEYEFYLLDEETGQPPFGGTPITTTLTNQRLPVLQQLVRHLQGPRALAADAQPRVGADAVRAHLRRRRGPRGRRRQLHVQDVREGDRRSARPARKLHDEAVHRAERLEQPSPREPLRRRSQHLLGRRRERADAGVPLGDRRAARARAGAERLPRPDRQLRRSATARAPTRPPASPGASRTAPSRCGSRPAAATTPTSRTGSGRGHRTRTSRFAGMLVAMLDGIRRQIEPPEPLATSAYQLDDLELLPRTLEESLDAFEARRGAARRVPPRVREGVPGPEAPRGAEGARGRTRLRRPPSGTTR